MPMVFKFNKDEIENGNGQPRNVIINEDAPRSEIKDNKVQVFARKLDAPEALGEFQVKFSDYRNVGGVQLPYKWTQTVGGQPDQTVDVVNYEINPANISEKFNQAQPKTLMRTRKSSK
jgi:hypothetical protein